MPWALACLYDQNRVRNQHLFCFFLPVLVIFTGLRVNAFERVKANDVLSRIVGRVAFVND
jgi:hypothetical protein